MGNHIEWAKAPESNPQLVNPAELVELGELEEWSKHAFELDTGSSSMIIIGTKAELIELAETLTKLAAEVSPGFITTTNVPGYSPTSDPVWHQTITEAWEYHRSERYDAFTDADVSEENDATINRLQMSADGQWEPAFGVSDHNGTGTIYGTTPGYEGDHDLGLAYTVTAVQE
jgi:hypothetical protein